MFHKKIFSKNLMTGTVLLLSHILLGFSFITSSWGMEPEEESKVPTKAPLSEFKSNPKYEREPKPQKIKKPKKLKKSKSEFETNPSFEVPPGAVPYTDKDLKKSTDGFANKLLSRAPSKPLSPRSIPKEAKKSKPLPPRSKPEETRRPESSSTDPCSPIEPKPKKTTEPKPKNKKSKSLSPISKPERPKPIEAKSRSSSMSETPVSRSKSLTKRFTLSSEPTEPTEPKPKARANSLTESKPKSFKHKKSKPQPINDEYLLEKDIRSLENLRGFRNASLLSADRRYSKLEINLPLKDFETIINGDEIEGVKQPLREHISDKLVRLKANQDIESRRERELIQEKEELKRLTCEEFIKPTQEESKRLTVPEKIEIENQALKEVAVKSNLSIPFKEIFSSSSYGILKEVHISCLPLGGSSIATSRLQDLLAGLTPLGYLSILTLRSCGIDDKGAEMLGPFLKSKRRLQDVDVRHNKIGAAGVLTILSYLANRAAVSRGFNIKIDNTLESKVNYEFLIFETPDDFSLIKEGQLGLVAEGSKLCCKAHDKKEIWLSSDPIENPIYSNEINTILGTLQPLPSEKRQESDVLQSPFEKLAQGEYNYARNKLLQYLSELKYIPQAGGFTESPTALIKSLESKGIKVIFGDPKVLKD